MGAQQHLMKDEVDGLLNTAVEQELVLACACGFSMTAESIANPLSGLIETCCDLAVL